MNRFASSLPAVIIAGIGPWLLPFRKIDLINSRWRPEIDAVTDGVIVIGIAYLVMKHRNGHTDEEVAAGFWRGTVVAVSLAAFCYAMKQVLIYLIDADYVVLANIPWAIAYAVAFLYLARAIYFLLLKV